MSEPLFLALDAGTSSCRALVFDRQGRLRASAQRPLAVGFPQPGWVEQSATEILSAQVAVAREAVAQAGGPGQFAGAAIVNQRETALVWERDSRKPIAPAIVWQCRRTAEQAAALLREHGDEIHTRSGLRADAYFSGPKIAWLLEHTPGARELAQRGALLAGTVDTWLLANLCAGNPHLTDRTNASRTMLWNLRDGHWDDELCEWQRVPRSMLAEVRPSVGDFGRIDRELLGREIPVLAVAGDQQAALIGHGIAQPGSAKCTYGTGAFVLAHAGTSRSAPPGLLLTASADGGVAYEGGVFTAGSVVQWLRDQLGFAEDAAGISALAASTPDSGGVSLIPALSGIGAPHWAAAARGAIVGLSRGTTKAQIARAALEGIAFRVREIVEAMEADGTPVAELKTDGGMSESEIMLQIQANALQRPVARPQMLETTALGGARLAMQAAGVAYEGVDQAAIRFEPTADLEAAYARWASVRRAVQQLDSG